MHIVQLSYDDSLLADPDGETMRRQQHYLRALDQLQPGSVMSVIVMTHRRGSTSRQSGALFVIPFNARRAGFRKPWAWTRLFRLLRRLDRQRRIDVLTTQTVHDEAWVALLFGRLKRRPVVGQIHTDIFSAHVRRSGPLRRFGVARAWAIDTLLPRFSAIRVVGSSLARRVSTLAPNVPVAVTPVAMPIVTREAYRADVSQPPIVLFVGRLVPSKNLDMWLDVARLLSRELAPVQFEIIGDGAELVRLRDRAAQLGLEGRVSFVGPLDNSSLPDRYGRASVFLLTSFYEGFGRVVVEALAHGLPVVAPGITGVEDIVDDGETGFLVDPVDAESLATRVRWLLEHPDARRAFGVRGMERMRARYDSATLSTAWMTVLVETAQAAEQA